MLHPCSRWVQTSGLTFLALPKILRLVVERVEFVEDQIMIKHVIPVSDVRLRRNQRYTETPTQIYAAAFHSEACWGLTGAAFAGWRVGLANRHARIPGATETRHS